MKHVFLHGLGQDPASWDEVVRAMGLGDEALRPGLLGWLRGREIAYSNLYKALEEYCGTLDRPLNLCGMSLGGELALEYAIKHPERVNALALIGTQCASPKGLLRLQSLLFRLMPASSFRGMGLPKGDVIRLTGSMMDLDFRQALGKLRCPVLAVCGERDKANRAAARELREKVPNARLAVIPGAGHEVNVDQPAVLGAELARFFGEGW